MSTTVFAIQSVDGKLELALCSASIELHMSAQAAKDFDAAFEAAKSPSWLPFWQQVKSALVSAAQFVTHKFADTLTDVPLEAVTAVTAADGRLQVLTADGNQLAGNLTIEFGAFKYECDLDEPGLFAADEAAAFAERFTQVKPLYEAYLAELRQAAP